MLVIAVNYLLVSKELRRLNLRRFLLASLAFSVFLIPVLVQIALKSDQLLEFLGDSGQRATIVPWYYYLDKLTSFEGFVTPVIWVVGILIAVRKWTPGDRLLLFWVFVVLLFFHVYPLKAFNYLLPLIPAASILAGRAVHDVGLAVAERWKRLRRRSGVGWMGRAGQPIALSVALLVPCLGAVFMVKPVVDVARTDTYFGLREAAKWLKANTSPQAGVMTLSKGSAQYALSFYAHRDAYPFGRFRLATVLPGGKVISPHPAADGPSRDWVTYWPPRLVKSRDVSYLVYYTDEGDDPPENPLVDSNHQERFRRFIESYGGRLEHVVYRNHEARAWIYKVTKLLPRPRITFKRGARYLRVTGEGFRFNSRVSLYYHQPSAARGRPTRTARSTRGSGLPTTCTTGTGWSPRTTSATTPLRGARADPAEQAGATAGSRAGWRGRARADKPRRARGAPGTPLRVELNMPDAVPVGSELPVRVKVKGEGKREAVSPDPCLLQDLLAGREDPGEAAGALHQHARRRLPACRGTRATRVLQAHGVRVQGPPPRPGDADVQGPAPLAGDGVGTPAPCGAPAVTLART